MQQLVEKIKEFTKDGSPSVGQWIELTDLAKKAGVKKTEMERMVEDVLTNLKEGKEESIQEDQEIKEVSPEIGFEFPRPEQFDRPDPDEMRNAFEKEMLERRQKEERKLEADVPEFERPEITFPELEVTFNKVDFPEPPTSKPIEEVEQPAKVELNVTPPKVEKSIIPEMPSEVPPIKPKEEETYLDLSQSSFDQQASSFESKVEQEDVFKYILESNKRAQEAAEEQARKEELAREKREKEQQRKVKPQQKSQYKREERRNDSSFSHTDAKKARNIGIAALVTALLFGFIGLIVGIYGYNESKKLKEAMSENKNLYGDEIKQNVNLGMGLSIAGIVIGGIRLFNFVTNIF